VCDKKWYLKARFTRSVFYIEEWREMELSVTAVRNTHIIVYWYIEGNTDLHNGDVIVVVVGNIHVMYDCTCNNMKCSTRIGVSGVRQHRDSAGRNPIDSKVIMFMLCIHLMECYIMNSIWSLAMNILYVYIQSVINEVWDLL
jgi:hypothetical protein